MISTDKSRLRQRLTLHPDHAERVFAGPGMRSDFDLNPDTRALVEPKPLRPAAVLVGLLDRPAQGLHVILTQRADHLSAHAGQVSFPGGRIEADDKSPLDAALREAQEEAGIDPALVDPIGYLDTYETGTGFRILPVVGLVDPQVALSAQASEVAHIFEVPLSFLMDPTNHQRHARTYQGRERHYFAIAYGEHYIWGATAGMLVNLYNRVFRA